MDSLVSSHLNVYKELRRFWEQQVLWMRSFIISSVDELDDLVPVTERLFRNANDFLLLLQAIFGRRQSERFASFITAHMSRIRELIDAMKRGDQENIDRLTAELYENAETMASIFAMMNPFWQEEQWNLFLYNFVNLTIQQIVARLARDHEAGIRIFDEVENNIYRIADYMAEGIIFSFNQ
jgi:hypothetical protein